MTKWATIKVKNKTKHIFRNSGFCFNCWKKMMSCSVHQSWFSSWAPPTWNYKRNKDRNTIQKPLMWNNQVLQLWQKLVCIWWIPSFIVRSWLRKCVSGPLNKSKWQTASDKRHKCLYYILFYFLQPLSLDSPLDVVTLWFQLCGCLIANEPLPKPCHWDRLYLQTFTLTWDHLWNQRFRMEPYIPLVWFELSTNCHSDMDGHLRVCDCFKPLRINEGT